MRPPDNEVRRLVAEWVRKADLDFETAVRLAPEERFREIVAFHAQQSAEKYLKALLTRRQIDFPKTHVISRLLLLVQNAEPSTAEALNDSVWLGPFGVVTRYPNEFPEMRPGDELRAVALASQVKDHVMGLLGPYLGL